MNEIEFNRSAINPGDCVGTGWQLVVGDLGTYIGVAVVTAIIYFAASLIAAYVPLVNVVITSPLIGGIYFLAIRHVDGEPIDFSMMFKGFEKIGPLMLLTIIQSLPIIVIVVLQYTGQIANLFGIPLPSGTGVNPSAPLDPRILSGLTLLAFVVILVYFAFSIVWALVFFFSVQLVMDKDLSVIEAISTSARAAFSNAGGAIVLMILCGFVMLLGLIAICLGLLVAIPVTWVAHAAAYRAVFPRLDQTQWQTPPPPSAYGNIFGQGM